MQAYCKTPSPPFNQYSHLLCFVGVQSTPDTNALAIAALVLSCVAIVLVAAAGVWWIRKRRSSAGTKNEPNPLKEELLVRKALRSAWRVGSALFSLCYMPFGHGRMGAGCSDPGRTVTLREVWGTARRRRILHRVWRQRVSAPMYGDAVCVHLCVFFIVGKLSCFRVPLHAQAHAAPRVFPQRAHAQRPRPGLPGAGLRNMDTMTGMLTLHGIPVPGTMASREHN